jgi:hypothetical protein
MALVNGFDPSKEYVVVKGFFEGGKQYRPGDAYNPRTKIGKSKVLFRHFIAKRIKMKDEQVAKSESQAVNTTSQPTPETTSEVSKEGVEDSVKTESTKNTEQFEDDPKPAPKRRGRRKKSETAGE